MVQAVQTKLFRSNCSDPTVQIQLFRSNCSDPFRSNCSGPTVQIQLFRSNCLDPIVQTQLFRSNCSDPIVQFQPSRRISANYEHGGDLQICCRCATSRNAAMCEITNAEMCKALTHRDVQHHNDGCAKSVNADHADICRIIERGDLQNQLRGEICKSIEAEIRDTNDCGDLQNHGRRDLRTEFANSFNAEICTHWAQIFATALDAEICKLVECRDLQSHQTQRHAKTRSPTRTRRSATSLATEICKIVERRNLLKSLNADLQTHPSALRGTGRRRPGRGPARLGCIFVANETSRFQF